MRMKHLLLPAIMLLASGMVMTGCKKDKGGDPDPVGNNGNNGSSTSNVRRETVSDMNTTTGTVYLNLTTGEQFGESAAAGTGWDISFSSASRSVDIAVNGQAGAQLLEASFDDLSEAPAEGYKPGTEGIPGLMSWANYTGGTTDPKHAVLPKPGLSIAVRTVDGKYAKLQIISIYKGNPNTTTAEFANLATRPEMGHLTFRYAIQLNGSRNF